MVISMDALQSRAGLAEEEVAANWTRWESAEDEEGITVTSGRGMVLGLLLSAFLWIGVIAAVRGLIALLS